MGNEKIEVDINTDAKEVAVDRENYFSIKYIEKIKQYFLDYVAWYDRYYAIEKDDYTLYKNNKEEFYKKFDLIIHQKDGNLYYIKESSALRDYCIKASLPTGNDDKPNCFQHHVWWKGYLWAKILWNNKYYLVLPNTQTTEEFNKETGIKLIPNSESKVLFGIEYDKLNIEYE